MRGVGPVFVVEQGVRLYRTVQVRELWRKRVKISDVGHKNIVCAGHIHRKLTGNCPPLKRGNKRCNQRKQLIVQQNSDCGCFTHTDRETDTNTGSLAPPQASPTPRLLRPRWASRRLRHTRFASVRHTRTTPHATPRHPARPVTRPHSPPQPPKRTLWPLTPPAASQPATRPLRPRHSRVRTHRPRPQLLPPSLTARHRRRNRRGDHLPLPCPVRPSQATPGTKTGVLRGRRRGRIHRAAVRYRSVL